MLKWLNEYIIKNFATCKNYTAFKEKHPNINIGSKWCALAGSKMTHYVCICKSSSKFCVASWCNGLGLDIQWPDLEDCLQHWDQQMHWSWYCNSERNSWSGTQRTSRQWEI